MDLSFMLGVGLDESPPPKRPRNVVEGVRALFAGDRAKWNAMAKEGWDLRAREAHLLSPMAVVETIRQTSKCEEKRTFTEYFIDSRGKYRVRVYD